MNRYLSELQKNIVIRNFGGEYYDALCKNVDHYAQIWALSDIQLAKISSHNVLFFCKSKRYGSCVLKLYGLMWEVNTLNEYRDSGEFCKVYEFDLQTRVLLMERIIPGDTLRDEPSLEKRLESFVPLFQGLHREPEKPELYQSYLKMACDVTEAMKAHESFRELLPYATKMKGIFIELTKVYHKNMLLHWDMNNENILLSQDGSYKLIDPMGLTGDPVLETGRFLSKEYSDARKENRVDIIRFSMDYFEANLKIPKKVLQQCFYIDIVFLNCHFAEHGKPACMEDIKFAETVLCD